MTKKVRANERAPDRNFAHAARAYKQKLGGGDDLRLFGACRRERGANC